MVILFIGVYKFVAPAVWMKYAAPWITTLWPTAWLSFEKAMMLNGVFEILFGLAILAGIYTSVTAGIVALSLAAVVLELGTSVVVTGKFLDILLRDIGLFVLATGVTLLAADREAADKDGHE